MKSILDQSTRDEVIERVNRLTENSTPQWGKMNIYQMLHHCVLCEQLYLGKIIVKRVFIGKIFGKMALKNMLKDETPIKPNSPTNAAFKVSATSGDVYNERDKWISLIREYENFSNNNFEHWFFGKMTKEQVGYFVYKHTDHHLRQFNV